MACPCPSGLDHAAPTGEQNTGSRPRVGLAKCPVLVGARLKRLALAVLGGRPTSRPLVPHVAADEPRTLARLATAAFVDRPDDKVPRDVPPCHDVPATRVGAWPPRQPKAGVYPT